MSVSTDRYQKMMMPTEYIGLTFKASVTTRVDAELFSIICLEASSTNSEDPDQTTPIGAV